MKIDEKIYSLRKEHNLSQEELADKLNVSRQTISKWETGESCPDFNKIVPLCDLFGITTEELLRDKKNEKNEEITQTTEENETPNVKKSLLICGAIFMYFIALASVILGEEFLNLNDGLVVAIFFTICGLATATIIFTCMIYPGKKQEKEEKKEKDPILNGIISVVTLTATLLYLVISFATMAWHITWMIWIIFAIIVRIIKLIYSLKEENHE